MNEWRSILSWDLLHYPEEPERNRFDNPAVAVGDHVRVVDCQMYEDDGAPMANLAGEYGVVTDIYLDDEGLLFAIDIRTAEVRNITLEDDVDQWELI